MKPNNIFSDFSGIKEKMFLINILCIDSRMKDKKKFKYRNSNLLTN